MYVVYRKLMAHMVPQTQIWLHHLQYFQVHHQYIMTALSVLATTLILYRPLLWTELLAWNPRIWVLCFWDWDLKNTWVSFILIHKLSAHKHLQNTALEIKAITPHYVNAQIWIVTFWEINFGSASASFLRIPKTFFRLYE